MKPALCLRETLQAAEKSAAGVQIQRIRFIQLSSLSWKQRMESQDASTTLDYVVVVVVRLKRSKFVTSQIR